MNNGQLDEADIKILNLLQQDARMDAAKISQLIHKSEHPTRQRLLKLKESGHIRNFVAILDRSKVGKPVLVVTLVKLERQTKTLLREFEATAETMDEVQFCLHLSGKWDFILHVTAETPQHYYDFLMDKLCDLPNVAHVESSFVLKESKSFSPFKL